MKNGLVERADGTKEWFMNDLHHRQDGPAIEYADGTTEWWLNGYCLMPVTEVTMVNSKTEEKPSPGDLVKGGNNLLLITAVAGDAEQGYYIAFHK